MVPFLPKQIAQRAILIYLISLVVVSLLFSNYTMKLVYMVIGFSGVCVFFALTSYWSQGYRGVKATRFVEFIFILALFIRLGWVAFAYFYYTRLTGMPFEFDAADSIGYHEEAVWFAGERWKTVMEYYFGPFAYGISDVGYPLYLTFLYKVFGTGVLLPRIIKAFLSTWTCILVYKLSVRTFGDEAGRMAGLMCALMPNLVIYCGYHLKETEMLFLEVAFLERLDFLLRSRRVRLWNVLLPTVLAGSLFFFRTILGATAVFAFISAILLASTPMMKTRWKRTALVGWGVLCLAVFSGGTAVTEMEALWEEKDDNLSNKRIEQVSRGNQWAHYATGAVMSPMAFVLPFSTMVNVDEQYGQQEKHGGNYIRNFMGFFALLAIYEAIRRKQWRDFVLIGSFAIAYLGVVSLSGFSNSERFLLPGLPCLIMMWAYWVSTLRDKTWRLLTPWCLVVLAMEIGWAYFKLGSRGLFLIV